MLLKIYVLVIGFVMGGAVLWTVRVNYYRQPLDPPDKVFITAFGSCVGVSVIVGVVFIVLVAWDKASS